jgi:hypothetical protein
MVNLIPPSAKKSVILEYWFRVLTVWSLLGTLVVILFAITITPIYVLVNAKIDAYQESATMATEKIAAFQSVSDDLMQSSRQAEQMISNFRTLSLYQVVSLFGALEGNGISLSSINVNRGLQNSLAPVNISGRATDRQALADFRDRLLAEDAIEVVDFPISNLAQDRDINFSMTVTMSNELNI